DQTQINEQDNLPHYPDTYKRPWHESFSNESIYAAARAPQWQGEGEQAQLVPQMPDRGENISDIPKNFAQDVTQLGQGTGVLMNLGLLRTREAFIGERLPPPPPPEWGAIESLVSSVPGMNMAYTIGKAAKIAREAWFGDKATGKQPILRASDLPQLGAV